MKWIACAIFFVSVFGLGHPICPERCTCSDHTQTNNIVNCSSTFLPEVPQNIPENVTELYLDGGFLKSLKRRAFIKNKKLKILYLNESFIETIEKRAFYGLKELEILRLNMNVMPQLKGYEFNGLTGLKELYLQYNVIRSISNSTFTNLKVLKVLHLHFNRIIDFNFWNLPSSLKDVTLFDNPLSCDCEYTKKVREWMIKSNSVSDLDKVQCLYNPADRKVFYFNMPLADYPKFGFYINKNNSACTTKDLLF